MISETEQLRQLLASHFWDNETTIQVSEPVGVSLRVFCNAGLYQWEAKWADETTSKSERPFPSMKEAKDDLRECVAERECPAEGR